MQRHNATRTMRHTIVATILLLAGCGTTSSSDPTSGWIQHWCDVRVTMTTNEAVALMGEPTRQRLDGPNPYLQWDHAEYQFNAFLGADGRVRQLDTNTVQLTDQQQRDIGCGQSRTQ